DVGRQRARARAFLDGAESIRTALALVEEARGLLAQGEALPLEAVFDVREKAERAARGALLEPGELQAVARTLFAFSRTRAVLALREQAFPGLAAIGRALPDLQALAARLDNSLEADGTVSERASPTLREARTRV